MNESEAFIPIITQLCGTKFQLLQACLRGGGGGGVAHFENDTASEK